MTYVSRTVTLNDTYINRYIILNCIRVGEDVSSPGRYKSINKKHNNYEEIIFFVYGNNARIEYVC